MKNFVWDFKIFIGPMRSISFENLRRLVSRKKDRNEPSFKRSESFKRISIRKSYLDRGKRRNKLQKTTDINNTDVVAVVVDVQNETKKIIDEIDTSNFIQQQDLVETKIQKNERTIGYDEWLNDVNTPVEKLKEDLDNSRQSIIKPKVIKPPRRTRGNKTPDSITKELGILRLDSSPVFPRCSNVSSVNSTMLLESAEEDLLGQDLSLSMISTEGPPSVSVSLGRVWLDAVPVPFPVHGLSPVNCAVHHSLDSALKERKQSGQSQVARTVSAPEKSRSTIVSKDFSSFGGFSLSTSKITDLKSKRTGLFRKKIVKPSPSVSVDGYFKRTMTTGRSSGRTKIKSSPITVKEIINTNNETSKLNNQVWFIPPEKRSSKKNRQVWQEIRYFTIQEGRTIHETKALDDWSLNISDEFDDQQLLLSGDFNVKQTLSNSIHSSATSTMTSSFLSTSSSKSSGASEGRRQKISDFNEDKIFSEELRGILAQRPIWQPPKDTVASNFFASRQFLNFLAKKTDTPVHQQQHDETKKKYNGGYYRCLSSSESEIEESIDRHNNETGKHFYGDKRRVKVDDCLVQRERPRASKRRPLRRKSQLRRANGVGQPVYLVRKCSSLRKRPSKIDYYCCCWK